MSTRMREGEESITLREGERIDDLQRGGFRIIQRRGAFCFGTDAVLLSHFAAVRPGERMADLGTGTGVLPLLIYARRGFANCLALEIQPDMADMARRSVALNGLSERIEVREMDYLELPSLEPSLRFDSLVCNPPYVKSGAGQVSATTAHGVARHETAATLEAILRCASRLLKNGGYASFIIQSARLAETMRLMHDVGMEPKRLRLVQHHALAKPSLALLSGRRNGNSGLDILAPLVLCGPDGEYTPEAKAIYEGE